MDEIPSNSILIQRAEELEATLSGMTPSPDFTAGAIESLRDALSQIAAELQGERELHITRFRPDSLTSYLRNNYESTLETPEGRDVYEFIRLLTERAVALDLPPIVPVNRREEGDG